MLQDPQLNLTSLGLASSAQEAERKRPEKSAKGKVIEQSAFLTVSGSPWLTILIYRPTAVGKSR